MLKQWVIEHVTNSFTLDRVEKFEKLKQNLAIKKD
jgi:hypothetical protein